YTFRSYLAARWHHTVLPCPAHWSARDASLSYNHPEKPARFRRSREGRRNRERSRAKTDPGRQLIQLQQAGARARGQSASATMLAKELKRRTQLAVPAEVRNRLSVFHEGSPTR